MKSLFSFVAFSFFININIGLAQSVHTTHWYFGKNAGLDFSSGSPISIGNSGMIALEGSTTYSDENGNLLFYSNGVRVGSDIAAVWNKNHQIMPNGILSDLTGYSTTIQSSIVVPVPGTPTQYYLFTLDGYENYYSENYKGLTYSIIDMTLDGGNGDIVDKAVPISAPATPFLSEQMAVTCHSNGTDYWLIIHENNHINLTNNKFIIYQISASGISAPIIQNIGMDDSPGMQSSLQVSSQGDRIAFNWEVFDFDNSTGVLSNPIPIGNSWGYREFSRNGRFLYVSKWDVGLFQYDLEAQDIVASAVQLSSYQDFGQIQIGPDNKIYIAMDFAGAYQANLSVINNPDQSGFTCDLTLNAITLVDGVSSTGLPNFIDFVPKNHSAITEINDQNVFLYPNPASSTITLNFGNEENSFITLIDGKGQVIMNKKQAENGDIIDVSKIPTGIYFVKIEIDNKSCWKKLILN